MSRVELLVLRAGDEQVLREWTRASSIPAGLAQRARILLLAAEGQSNTEIGRLVAVRLEPPPEKLGVTHWSARLLADHLDISFATVARIWRRWGLQPWKAETFKYSTDPELEAKIRDVVGLYLDPPTKAVVVCIDEKTHIQALDRTAPILPV